MVFGGARNGCYAVPQTAAFTLSEAVQIVVGA